jgi:hypothetical protein
VPRIRRLMLALFAVLPIAAAPAQAAVTEAAVSFQEFTVSPDALCELRQRWADHLLATQPAHTWAPIEYDLTDQDLASLGLPSKEVLLSQRYPTPTLVTQDGRRFEVGVTQLEAAIQDAAAAGPTAATYGGAGCLGIRPGAWLLLISGNSIGWCSMAHVYGSPGSYDISTAGHCGNTGDTATVIAALGNRADATGVVLLDFGSFATSHDGGLGNDWALIDIDAQYQGLVSPTMCFWGGPRGMFTKTGDVASISWPQNGLPSVSLNPDPLLAQGIVHYGHGAGVGAGGTPRIGTAIAWRTSHFMFEGAATPGDSGSGINTVGGDTVGATMEAAGILTHIWIDPLMRDGIGIMGGTRATQVSGTLANGQLVGYPVPVSGLP